MTTTPDSTGLAGVIAQERSLQALAQRLVGDPHDAEEAVQHALTQEALGRRKADTPLGPFLRAVVRHRALNLRQQAQRRRRHERVAARPATVPSAAEMAAREQLRRHLADAVMALPAAYREAIWLRHFEDVPAAMIAQRLGVPLETVRTRLRRARSMLSERLDGEYGDRRLWAAMVVPSSLAVPAKLGGPAWWIAGWVMKKWIAGVVALVLMGTAVIAWQPWRGDLPPVGQRDNAVTEVARDPGGGSKRPDREVLASHLPQSGLPQVPVVPAASVVLRHADGSPAVDVPLTLWTGELPNWVQGSISAVDSRAPLLPQTDGLTDSDGRWPLPEAGRRDLCAVTFQAAPGLLVSYAFEDARGELAFELPALVELAAVVTGAPPGEQWKVRVALAAGAPASDRRSVGVASVGGNSDYSYHHIENVVTASGPAVLSLRSHVQQLAVEQRFSVPAVAGIRYAVWGEGVGFDVDQRRGQFRVPPATLVYRLKGLRPLAVIEVLDPETGAVVEVDGRIAIELADKASFTWFQPLRSGRGYVEPRSSIAEPRRLHVLLEEVEYFEAVLRFQEGEMRKHVRFTRDQGRRPQLVAFGGPGVEHVSVVTIESASGQLRNATKDTDQGFSDLRGHATWLQRDGELWLSLLPEGWRQGWIVERSGRVARLDPVPGGPPRARWLPDVALENIDLQAIGSRHGESGAGVCRLQVDLVGNGAWATADWYDFTSEATPPPVWRKRVPRDLPYRVDFFARSRLFYRDDAPDRVEVPVRRR